SAGVRVRGGRIAPSDHMGACTRVRGTERKARADGQEDADRGGHHASPSAGRPWFKPRRPATLVRALFDAHFAGPSAMPFTGPGAAGGGPEEDEWCPGV